MSNTIVELLARTDADAPALLAPGRPVLSFGGLRRQMEVTVGQLNDFGDSISDRRDLIIHSRSNSSR